MLSCVTDWRHVPDRSSFLSLLCGYLLPFIWWWHLLWLICCRWVDIEKFNVKYQYSIWWNDFTCSMSSVCVLRWASEWSSLMFGNHTETFLPTLDYLIRSYLERERFIAFSAWIENSAIFKETSVMHTDCVTSFGRACNNRSRCFSNKNLKSINVMFLDKFFLFNYWFKGFYTIVFRCIYTVSWLCQI